MLITAVAHFYLATIGYKRYVENLKKGMNPVRFFVFFYIFAINMVLQYKKVGPWKDYLYGERVYIVLSLLAKSVLCWLIFTGTLAGYRNSLNGSEGHPRWRGKPAMTAVPKYIARNLNALLEKQLVSLHRDPEGWIAWLADGDTVFSSSVVLTAPVPQSLILLDAGEVDLPSATRTRLENLEYERCLAVMAVLNGPARIPPPGGLALTEGPIAWIADNQMKGVSATPAVTLHATPAFSLERWDCHRHASGLELLRAAQPWLGSDVIEFQVHGWRYSKPKRVDESPCLILYQSPALILAGDAFGGQRVEGAALSGWAAANFLKRNHFKAI